jgi:transposase
MQAIIERCCGLDVHQETVVACLLIGAAGARARKEVRTFRTVRRELEALRDRLKAAGVTHVGMESTGVYWRPVYAVLEGHVELIVGNARHIRNVPGRKTDVKDAEWIADLVRHGLIAKSFVPPAPLRELRELLRYRRKLIEAQAAERNRLLRLLETANIKLASVMSDVFGVSGRAMLKALIAGSAAPEEMAALARGQLRRKRAELIEALTGGIEEHHRFLLAMQFGRIEAIEADVVALDARIGERLLPYSAEMALLMTIPGVDWLVAAVIIAEIGTDMSVFLSVHHLAAWAGVCPGSYESAGKQKSGRARKGNVHLRTILVGAAISAARTKGSFCGTSSTASRPVAARCVPPWPLLTRLSWPPITCSPGAWPTAISEKPISTRSVSAAPLPISSAASNASATRSPSNPGPKPRDKALNRPFSWQSACEWAMEWSVCLG